MDFESVQYYSLGDTFGIVYSNSSSLLGKQEASITNLGWIIVGGILMSVIALVGTVTMVLSEKTLGRILLPMVALAAGTLLGGAFFHMIPEAVATIEPHIAFMYLLAGFTTFLALEQFLHWHQSHHQTQETRKPFTYLILIGDGIHNLIGGLSIASTFLINPQAGIIAWMAAVTHEIPQELGDFGILVHGGFNRKKALMWNFLSAITFLIGALLAYAMSSSIDLKILVMFGAGNFIYIAASDLVPEIKTEKSMSAALLHFFFFALGLVITMVMAFVTN